MQTLTFFNNKGGVGKTSLVYHLAWMFAELGKTVLAADLDPQANLTSMFLDEGQLLELWEQRTQTTIFGSVLPLLKGTGDIEVLDPWKLTNKLYLAPGDLGLSRFEDTLSDAWPRCFNEDERAFRAMTAFHRILKSSASLVKADLVLIDVGPNLGAINRASLLSSDSVVFPIAPDLFSLQGLQNLGPTLAEWRKRWSTLKGMAPRNVDLPNGAMRPLGYVVLQHGVYSKKIVKAYQRWAAKIPTAYRTHILENETTGEVTFEQDGNCLARLKHYKSLMPMAMESRKPIFFLKTADGALGAHLYAVQDCYQDFKKLAEAILSRLTGSQNFENSAHGT